MRALLLLLFCTRAFAQTDYFDKYYPLVDKAENAFCKDNFKEAIDYYKQAFISVKKPHARDIYNGVVCYYLAGNIDGAKPWLILLAKKGIAPELLESQEAFQEQTIKNSWQSFKPIYVQIQSAFEPQPTDELNKLKEKFDSNSEAIREIYKELPEYVFEYDSTVVVSKEDSLNNNKKFREVERIYYQMSFDAIEHILKHGFPEEGVFAIADDNFLSDRFKSYISHLKFYSELNASKLDTVLGQPKHELISKLNEKLIEEVAKGNIHRDYVLEVVKGDSVLDNLYFVRAIVSKDLKCDDRNEHLFIKPKTDSNSRYFDLLLGENEEYQIEKGKYALFKNEYFLMNDVATLEAVFIDRCEELSKMYNDLIETEPVVFDEL